MPRYRNNLPQLEGGLYLTDAGIETTLMFREGWALPHFAAFQLFNEPGGYAALQAYFATHAQIAFEYGAGFIFESATWRANPDWATLLHYSEAELRDINRNAITQLVALRDELDPDDRHRAVISGCIGPRGDGYKVDTAMSAEEAERYHALQIDTFAATDADMITAITMTNVDEALGITNGAAKAHIPVVLAFTVETDGRLPDGSTLADAIACVDAEADVPPTYYMVNCAHTTHFANVLEHPNCTRIRGVRANASRCSHAELDAAEALDDGDPIEFGEEHAALRLSFPHINVLGGCCGTDHRHMRSMAASLVPLTNQREATPNG